MCRGGGGSREGWSGVERDEDGGKYTTEKHRRIGKLARSNSKKRKAGKTTRSLETMLTMPRHNEEQCRDVGVGPQTTQLQYWARILYQTEQPGDWMNCVPA